MRRGVHRRLLLMLALLFVGVSSCVAGGGAYVGYGYTGDYYGDVFYTPPIDRYGGFYGHP